VMQAGRFLAARSVPWKCHAKHEPEIRRGRVAKTFRWPFKSHRFGIPASGLVFPVCSVHLATWPGFSGSPVFLSNGHVVSIHNMGRIIAFSKLRIWWKNLNSSRLFFPFDWLQVCLAFGRSRICCPTAV
jgi:hypothetical protein